MNSRIFVFCETYSKNVPLSFSQCCSKLGPKDQGEKAVEGALQSLSQLDMGYIDLFLIHWPGTQGLLVGDQRNPGQRALKSIKSFPKILNMIPFLIFCFTGSQWGPNNGLILGNRAQSWAALEELHAQGKLKAIGVSNYTPAHMRELMQSCKVPPAVLQVRRKKETNGFVLV